MIAHLSVVFALVICITALVFYIKRKREEHQKETIRKWFRENE